MPHLTFSFGFCFYFPLWLFFKFLISCLELPCPPVCKPEAIGNGGIENIPGRTSALGCLCKYTDILSRYFNLSNGQEPLYYLLKWWIITWISFSVEEEQIPVLTRREFHLFHGCIKGLSTLFQWRPNYLEIDNFF